MNEATAPVGASPGDIRPILIGATLPELTLTAVDESPCHLNAKTARKPVLLVFYRGGW